MTTRTLFQAGSISKPVAATAALYLVEQGKLSLDEDVNQKLKTWKVPENEFTKTEKVTLRRLMSHTAGLTVHGFPGIRRGRAVADARAGVERREAREYRADPRRSGARNDARYSGGGVTIEQLLMMDVTGKAFPALMRETVLDKIGMNDSSYEQPLPGEPRGDDGRWNLHRRKAGAWEMAYLSGDGGGRIVDDAH